MATDRPCRRASHAWSPEKGLIVGVRRLGDLLLQADIANDTVTGVREHGIGDGARHPAVAVLEGMDDG